MIKTTKEKYVKKLTGLSLAYSQVFNRDNVYLRDVLKDLAKFCRAHQSTWDSDPRKHAALEGRREVFLRITQYLELSVEELYALHVVKEIHDDENKEAKWQTQQQP